MVSVDSGNLIWYDYVMLISWSTSNGVKMSNIANVNNVNVKNFNVHDLLWNLEEYHREFDNPDVVVLCDEIIDAFHDFNSVMKVYYCDSELEFDLFVEGDDIRYPRYVIKIWESIEAAPSRGNILMMGIRLLDYETKVSVMRFKGPVYQMRRQLTFSENKALGKWVCGFDKGKVSNDEG